MHLVKWLRKNNVKVMAVVFVITLFGFIGGSYISQFSQRRRMGLHKTIAHFADDKKITNYDRKLAQQELEVLRMLHCDVLLKNISVPPFRTPDLRAILLGELLFSERGTSPELISYIKHIIKANGYRISSKQINDISLDELVKMVDEELVGFPRRELPLPFRYFTKRISFRQ